MQLDVDIKRRKLEQLTILIGRVNTNYNKLVKIDHLFQNIKNKLTQISNLKNQISKNQIQISKIQNSKLKFQKLNLLNEKAKIIKNSLLNINSIKQRINDVNNKLKIKLEQKNNFHKETGICPLCGSVIGEHK